MLSKLFQKASKTPTITLSFESGYLKCFRSFMAMEGIVVANLFGSSSS